MDPHARRVPCAQVLQLPLAGPLERGGLAFVLKRPPGRGSEWIKSAVGRDFFLDFSAVRRQAALHSRPIPHPRVDDWLI